MWWTRYMARYIDKMDAFVTNGPALEKRHASRGLTVHASMPLGIQRGFFSPQHRDEQLRASLLEQLGLTARFAAICGADTFGVSKPDPVILQQTVAKAGGEMSAVVMVGDAGPDVGVARRANVPVIGVTFGYTETPIADLNPDVIIDHFRDLPATVERLVPVTRS